MEKSPGGASAVLLRDDSALTPVPDAERRGWIPFAFIYLGAILAPTQFQVAAVVGYGMDFRGALWSTAIATVVLEAVLILMGIAGARAGLNLSVLSRWAGFGRLGSALVGLAVALSVTGWFGVQNGLLAEGLRNAVGGALPLWFCAVVGGLAITLLVVHGFRMLRRVAYVAVPALFLLATGDVVYLIVRHGALAYLREAAPGPTMSIVQGVTLVVGTMIVGAVIAPDYSRYNRTVRDVILQSVVGIVFAEFLVGFVGFILARAIRTSDIPTTMTSINGLLGALIVMLSVVNVNNGNLYSCSLGWVNVLDTVFGRQVNRGLVTIVFGLIGTALSALGFLRAFVPFLTALGVIFPPIAGVVIVDYFVIRSHRGLLAAARAEDAVPSATPRVVVPGLVAWAAGSAIGHWVAWGAPSVNALVSAGVVYAVLATAVGSLRQRTAAAAVGEVGQAGES